MRGQGVRGRLTTFAGWTWQIKLVTVTFVGLCIRVAYVLIDKRHVLPSGDSFYFHLQANLIVDGAGWFLDPWAYIHHHQIVQSAYHPPLWTLVLAAPSALGAKSYLSQLLWSCVVGAAAVFVTGLAGREVASERAGLIAAAIAAVYPNYWLNDGSGLAETLVLLLVAGLILSAYRFLRYPNGTWAVVVGVLCGSAALTRPELVVFVPLVLIALVLSVRSLGLRRRIMMAGVGTASALLIMAPWVGFNLSRFNQVELLSTQFGSGLASTNCMSAYYGPYTGYWSFSCQVKTNCSVLPIHLDESAWDERCRGIGLRYIEHHESRLAAVLVARVAREFGLFQPVQQLHLDSGQPALLSFETRSFNWAVVGLVMYYAMLPISLIGVLALRRRQISLVPMIGILATVVLSAAAIYGSTRFRSPCEVELALLTGIGVDSFFAGTLRQVLGRRPKSTG